MDAPPKPRNSRWDRAPVLDSNGRQKRALLTDRDIEILKLLARYRYLPIDDIHGFVGGSRKGLAHHVNLLSREPNLYLRRPPQQRESADANHRPLIYELDRRGRVVLQERGLPVSVGAYHHNFAHELMACRIIAAFELATIADPSLRFIAWDEIIANPKTPQTIYNSPTGTRIPISFTVGAKQHSMEICADGKPFGIEYHRPGEAPVYRFFPGVEADTGTEPLQASDIERSSIFKKLLAYLAIERDLTYRSHLGLPNLFVPFVTRTDSRMRSMMGLLEGLTEGRGSMTILFKTFTPHAAYTPRDHMLAQPWQRAGFSLLSLHGRTSTDWKHSP
jgi:hypothetical protein